MRRWYVRAAVRFGTEGLGERLATRGGGADFRARRENHREFLALLFHLVALPGCPLTPVVSAIPRKYEFREATACRMDLEILENSDQFDSQFRSTVKIRYTSIFYEF